MAISRKDSERPTGYLVNGARIAALYFKGGARLEIVPGSFALVPWIRVTSEAAPTPDADGTLEAVRGIATDPLEFPGMTVRQENKGIVQDADIRDWDTTAPLWRATPAGTDNRWVVGFMDQLAGIEFVQERTD